MTLSRVTGALSGEALVFDALAASIAEPGYGVFSEFFDPDLVRECSEFLQRRIDQGELVKSGIGKGAALEIRPEIRSDSIYWLEESMQEPVVTRWLEGMQEIREHLRRSLFLPLESYEGHLARYPKEGFYKPHLDQHRISPSRQITLIMYLNEAWSAEMGGQLRLYTDPKLGLAGPAIDVLPQAGTLVVFRSADFWHEVLPSSAPRNSLTGWFRSREL